MLALTPPQPLAPISYGSSVALASVVRGLQGVSLEQKVPGGVWETVRSVATGGVKLTAAPTINTDYRLATSTVASGAVRIRVAPVVTVTSATPLLVTGTVSPVLPNALVEVQQQNADLTWTTAGSGAVANDGTFSVQAAPTMGATIRVLAPEVIRRRPR